MIKFSCKSCGQKLNVEDKHSGKRVKCPKCGVVCAVPDNSDKIRFHCESCNQSISVFRIHAGKKGKCPKCMNPVVVPDFKREPSGDTPSIAVTCHVCAKSVQVPGSSIGQTIQCAGCGSYLKVSLGGVSTTAGKAYSLTSQSPDKNLHQDNSEATDDRTGSSRRLIFAASGVAVVALAGLIVLITVILPSGSTSSGNPQGQRERQPAVDVDREPSAITPTRESPRPSVTSHAQKKAVPIVDGKAKDTKIAFQSTRDGVRERQVYQPEIYAMSADGSEQKRLTNNYRSEGPYSWSPNGKKMVYYSGSSIHVMNADGGGQKELTSTASKPRYWRLWSPWSADGEKIVFVSEKTGAICVVNVDGTDRKNLAPGSWPSWSPDGKKIVFVSGKRSSNIYVISADGSELMNLTKDRGFDVQPSWSPDGKKIVFGSFGSNRIPKIYVMNLDGNNRKSLAPGSWPLWSPDGKKIVFYSRRNTGSGAYVMNADGSRQKMLIEDSPRDPWWPLWSPDGKKIAFITDRAQRDANMNIYIMNADGSGRRNLTAERGHDVRAASWSPDGRKIAFESHRFPDGKRIAYEETRNRSGYTDIYIINADGSEEENLTNSLGDNSAPSWRPGPP